MTTNQRELPQELVDCIIDHLHDDMSTLKACDLVSKSWTLSSYTHIFRFIPIAGRDRLQAFAFALQSSPIFPSFVRKLDYIEGPSFEPLAHTDSAGGTWSSALHDILRCLPDLRSLALQEVDISHYFNSPSIPAPRYTLELLSLHDCIATSSDLECILRAFEEIGSLSILYISPALNTHTPHDEIPASHLEPTPTELTRVHSIRMRAVQNHRDLIHSVLAASKRQIGSDSISAFDLLLQPDSIDLLKTFLDDLLPNLHEFKVDLRCPLIRFGLRESEVTEFIQWFTHFRQLKSLTISLVLSSDYLQDLRCRWVNVLDMLHLLSKGCRGTLCHLKIIWNIYGQAQCQVFSQSDWDMLSERLEYFQVLECIDFVWEMHTDDWEWLEENSPLRPDPFTIDTLVWETGPGTIIKLLPKLHSRRLLHFSTIEPETPPWWVY